MLAIGALGSPVLHDVGTRRRVGAQDDAIIHFDRDIPIDAHAVARLGHLTEIHLSGLPISWPSDNGRRGDCTLNGRRPHGDRRPSKARDSLMAGLGQALHVLNAIPTTYMLGEFPPDRFYRLTERSQIGMGEL